MRFRSITEFFRNPMLAFSPSTPPRVTLSVDETGGLTNLSGPLGCCLLIHLPSVLGGTVPVPHLRHWTEHCFGTALGTGYSTNQADITLCFWTLCCLNHTASAIRQLKAAHRSNIMQKKIKKKFSVLKFKSVSNCQKNQTNNTGWITSEGQCLCSFLWVIFRCKIWNRY